MKITFCITQVQTDGSGELFTILEKPQLIDIKMAEHMEASAGHVTQDIIMENLRVASRDGQ